MPLPLIFATCIPRADVLSGNLKDEQFAADLSQVIENTAPDTYQKPAIFFANTHPTRGLKTLLSSVCARLSGSGTELSSIFRLGTQYGGGKTHSLIALTHAARGMQSVSNVADFLDPALLPKTEVRIAALDGQLSDPANGLALGGFKIRSLWGELAYRLAGAAGYESVRESDEKHIAPGTDTLRKLFGNQPALILLDEVAVYLRKAERAYPGGAAQFAPFLQALLQAVASTPKVALVYTLALRDDATAQDSFQSENELAAKAFLEADKIAARISTILNPTEEDETASVLRTRLFASIDPAQTREVVDAYAKSWALHAGALPDEATSPELKANFLSSYPFHPKLLELLTVKTASLSTFQRTRGMLRLLSRTVNLLWKHKPTDATSIHAHHMDPGFEHIRNEIEHKLGQHAYNPALKADVASVPGAEPSVAQAIDAQRFPSQPPITSYLARTIFWHTLAFGEAAKGITPDRLRLSVLTPNLEPAFLDQARMLFVQNSTFLDDRTGVPMRFMVEPNLNMIIRRHESEVDPDAIRSLLKERIFDLYGSPRKDFFQPCIFPAGPYDLSDEVGDGRPHIAVMSYESCLIPDTVSVIPTLIAEIFTYKGTEQKPRGLRNNVVFVAPSERLIPDMQAKARRKLALKALSRPENLSSLALHQRTEVKTQLDGTDLAVAQAIQHAYRHIFYPGANTLDSSGVPLAHTTIERTNPPQNPGNGIELVQDVLASSGKLIFLGSVSEQPGYVRDQTGLRSRGEMSTAALWHEYKRQPKLALLIEPSPLMQTLRNGITAGIFVYREGNQVWGPGDPTGSVRPGDDVFIHTIEDAKTKNLWPRAEPLVLTFAASPLNIAPGASAQLQLTIAGGIGPFAIAASEPTLNDAATQTTFHTITVSPTASQAYEVTVTDSRGSTQKASTLLYVVTAVQTDSPGGPVVITPPAPPTPAKPQSKDIHDDGALPAVLNHLVERARREGFTAIEAIEIKAMFYTDAQKLITSFISLKTHAPTLSFDGYIAGEGIEEFNFSFKGDLQKAAQIRNNLDPLIRAYPGGDFKSSFSFAFPTPLPLAAPAPEDFIKSLNLSAASEVFVNVTVINAAGAHAKG